MNIATYVLYAAELDAERAGVQELRVRIDTVQSLRPQLNQDALEYAGALLLKLRHLVDEQTVALA